MTQTFRAAAVRCVMTVSMGLLTMVSEVQAAEIDLDAFLPALLKHIGAHTCKARADAFEDDDDPKLKRKPRAVSFTQGEWGWERGAGSVAWVTANARFEFPDGQAADHIISVYIAPVGDPKGLWAFDGDMNHARINANGGNPTITCSWRTLINPMRKDPSVDLRIPRFTFNPKYKS